ncbi:GntR family transcriptional regulator [Psychrobacillus lasiicapitis]|uniref:GntR family transcriptional regulator n=1 Tax=Psychrobacillus lasiicapitis TaxID=1636719 RepID=A0A544T2N9_9BACI|nr:GntR family transcriptional regulator [Psychrobacillus lasiicapitis]TQR11719.1 GntR family transcriptional regulator [Psychrobacillus lasiicapitis]GGA18936.1 GntR family transcriptional regulator [Psychrobacillus lasiicapitis]
MKKIIQKESLADQAFNSIKDAIIAGRLAQEEELPEEKLASDLGISRTPIREALKRLAAEGLVNIHKAKPATVASFTKDSALHYMEIRKLLEIHNIEKNADQLSDQVLYELQNNLEGQLEAIESDDYNSFMDFDRAFHLQLANIGGNVKLAELISQMNTGVNRAFLFLSNTLPVSAKDAYLEHVNIVQALEKKEKNLAKQLMILHLDNVEKRFLHYYTGEENK